MSEILLHLIKTRKPGSVLDVGDESPAFAKLIAREIPGIRTEDCTGPDLNSGAIAGESEAYDLILCRDVISRVADTSRFLNELKRLLNEEGIVIITAPNLAHWRCRLDILRGRLPAPADQPKALHQFTDSSLTEKIERAELMPLLRMKRPQGAGLLASWKPSLFSETLIVEAGKLGSSLPKKAKGPAVPAAWNL